MAFRVRMMMFARLLGSIFGVTQGSNIFLREEEKVNQMKRSCSEMKRGWGKEERTADKCIDYGGFGNVEGKLEE